MDMQRILTWCQGRLRVARVPSWDTLESGETGALCIC